MSPMRVRGLAAVRDAIESAPHPDDMPPMANIEDCAIPGPAGQIPVRIYRPSTAPISARAGLLPRRRHGDGVEPFVRAAGENACRPVQRHRGVGGLPARSRVPRTCPVRRRIYGYRMGCGARRADGRRRHTTGGRRRQCRRLAGCGGGPGGPGSRRPRHLLPGAALPRPRPRYDGGVDGRTPRCADAHATTTSSTCTSSPTPAAARRTTRTGCRPMRRT